NLRLRIFRGQATPIPGLKPMAYLPPGEATPSDDRGTGTESSWNPPRLAHFHRASRGLTRVVCRPVDSCKAEKTPPLCVISYRNPFPLGPISSVHAFSPYPFCR